MRTRRVDLAVGQHRPPAADFAPGRGAPSMVQVMDQLAATAVESGRQRTPGRNDQQVGIAEQITLRRQRVAAGVLLADAVVLPDPLAGRRVDRVQIDRLVRKHAGAEIGDPVLDHHTSADRPAGDHPAAGQQTLVGRARAKLPDQPSVRSVQTVRHAVLGTEIDPVLPNRRRHANRSFREEGPLDRSGRRIQAVQLMIDRGAEKRPAVGDHHGQRPVERHAVPKHQPFHRLVARAFPSHFRPGGRRIDPSFGERARQLFLGRAHAGIVVHKRRPRSARREIGGQRQQKSAKAHPSSHVRIAPDSGVSIHSSIEEVRIEITTWQQKPGTLCPMNRVGTSPKTAFRARRHAAFQPGITTRRTERGSAGHAARTNSRRRTTRYSRSERRTRRRRQPPATRSTGPPSARRTGEVADTCRLATTPTRSATAPEE